MCARSRTGVLRQVEIGSLAGAVRLLNLNAGVLCAAQTGQNPVVERNGKCLTAECGMHGADDVLLGIVILRLGSAHRGGARKITTGITGSWWPSVHSDVTFCFFDVGSSYPRQAELPKGRIVHPATGNVSWV